MKGLTSEFGMESGISPSLLSPSKILSCHLYQTTPEASLPLLAPHFFIACDFLYFFATTSFLQGMVFPCFSLKKGGQANGLISIG
jgi:hypothetical protein